MVRQLVQRRLLFRICGWLAVLLYLPVSTGVAVPMPGGKDLSRPFPCMYRQCGCKNAEQCWRSCCCHSLGERLAWADAKGVEPPDYVVNKSGARKSCNQVAPSRISCESKTCCKPKKVVKTCCSTREAPQKQRAADGISVIEALKCGGAMVGSWLGIAASVVPVSVHWSSSARVVGQVCCTPDGLVSLRFAPPSPPPWV